LLQLPEEFQLRLPVLAAHVSEQSGLSKGERLHGLYFRRVHIHRRGDLRFFGGPAKEEAAGDIQHAALRSDRLLHLISFPGRLTGSVLHLHLHLGHFHWRAVHPAGRNHRH